MIRSRIHALALTVPAGLVIASLLTPAASAQPPNNGPASLQQQIRELPVAAESHADSYDRDAFGDYNRAAILNQNETRYPDCVGYYSRADDTCYTFAEYGHDGAAEQVQIDESVARKEAWIFGAWDWPAEKRDRFVADNRANLVVMTGSLNQSKGADDVTGWLPPNEHTLCPYLQTTVDVKTDFDLTIDHDEQQTLLTLAATCPISG